MKYTTIKQHINRILCLALAVCIHASGMAAQVGHFTVKGIVSNQDGKGLEGVCVTFADGLTQTYTDADGRFTIKADKGMSLFFSKQNYKSAKLEVMEEGQLITLKMEVANQYGVYKVGYVERNRYNQVSAISTISAPELDKSVVTSAEQALTGKATGLTILRKSGNQPGFEASDIYIRGIGTFGQYRSPLILIDDIERDFSQLDIREIESVSVLKDGAANAQYGQRGANGTLLITTKRGFTGKPEIEFGTQIGSQEPTRLPRFLGSKEYVGFYNQAQLNDGITTVPSEDRFNPDMYNGDQNPDLYPDIDWYNSFLKKRALQQQYKLSFRGGTEVIKYFLLFGYLDQEGLFKSTNLHPNYNTNVNYNRYNIRSNFDAEVSKDLIISLDLAGRIENRNMPNESSDDIFKELSTITPNAMPIQYADGKLAGTSTYRKNPLGMIAHKGYSQERTKALQVKLQGVQKLDFITPGLAINATVAYDGISSYGIGKSADYATYEMKSDASYNVFGKDKEISLKQEKTHDFYQYLLAFHSGVSYTKGFGLNTILTDLRYYQSQLFKQGDNPAYARQGINGKATYSYDKKYIAEVSFAYDGSEEFAPGNRFGFFPSVAGGWILSSESFLENTEQVSFLKLRASYGEAGNNKTGFYRYAYQPHWYGFDASFGGYIFGSGYTWSDGAWEGKLPNPDLTWETTRNINIGIDAELFKLVSVNIDLFRNDRRNIIAERANTSSLITGAPFPYMNIGSVLNQGFEIAFNHQHKIDEVSYFIQANISFAKNKITLTDEVDGLPSYQQRTGKSVTQLWGMEALGFYADEEDIRKSPVSTFYGVKPGDIKYKNQNPDEDKHLNEYDEIPIGKPQVPEWTFGLSFGADYKGFDIAALLTGVANKSVYLNNAAVWGIQNNNKATSLQYGAWEKGVREADATQPRLTTEKNLNNYRSSSFWIKNGNFLRLSNLEIGYTIPYSIIKNLKIKKIRLYLNGQNLLSIDHLREYNLDPEVVDAGVTGYPTMRVCNIGLNVKF